MAGQVQIGFLLTSHLGDALCSTPLAKLVVLQKRESCFITRHRSTLAVFENNPYVIGHSNLRAPNLRQFMKGHGHIIQRLQRGFGVSVSDHPKPEIYLTPHEREWAHGLRTKWPSDRPVCLLAPRVVTNSRRYAGTDWEGIAGEWLKHCTVIQPVISSQHLYKEQIGLIKRPEEWNDETIAPEAIILRDLPLRRYMALFSIIDFFCGGFTPSPVP